MGHPTIYPTGATVYNPGKLGVVIQFIKLQIMVLY